MPMTLRPGTTATRADRADMERAISSERPDDTRGFDARRRFEFIEGNHWTWPHVDDLAANPEVLQHAFEQPGTLFQRLLANNGRSWTHGSCKSVTGGKT